jgi:murein L,D-transpeptidase YafK
MQKLNLALRFALVASALLPWNATAIDHTNFSGLSLGSKFSPNYTESLLIKSLLEVTQGQLQQALDTTDQLLRTAPNFKLAHLVRGDLLMARAQHLKTFGSDASMPSETVSDFRAEARSRIEHYLSQQTSHGVPESIWQLDSSQQHAIVIDAQKSRLYVYRNENGKPTYVSDYYVTLGKNGSEKHVEGDKRTPLGVYLASSKLQKKLPDFYGDAAYPLNYPNEWDKHQGKKGHGIWLHGTASDTYSRAPRASDGCVVMANPDLKSLAAILQNGKTPVIITDNMQWLEADETAKKRQQLSDALESWRQDWEAQNTDSYLAHYSQEFFSQSTDLSGWARHKKNVQANKSQVDIKLSNISMFRYPDKEKQMAIVSFDQSYKSNNLDSHIRKRQYWVLEDQRWKIMYEGSI